MGKKTAVVWGYFTKNLGDDLMLKAFLNATKGNYKKVYINSYKRHKQYYAQWGVTVVSLDSLIIRVINKLLFILKLPELYFWLPLQKNTDFIMLGGSLFAENPDPAVNQNQIRNLKFAVNCATQAYVVGSNFGPYASDSFLQSYAGIFEKCTDVCFRDQYSLSLFANNPIVRYAPDIILSGEWNENAPANHNDLIVISPINLENRYALKAKTNEYEQLLAEIAKYHVAKNDRVILAAFCEHEGDVDACRRIKDICGNPNIEIAVYKDLEFLRILKNSKKIYGSRFHSVILAMYYNTPCAPFVYGPKTYNALKSYCSSFECVNMTELAEHSLMDITDRIGIHDTSSGLQQSAKLQLKAFRSRIDG